MLRKFSRSRGSPHRGEETNRRDGPNALRCRPLDGARVERPWLQEEFSRRCGRLLMGCEGSDNS
jgi:hypothetical protein